MSAENEQNASEVQDVSENELEQLSKAARQKYETKKEPNRYKQQTRAQTLKAPAKIEFVDDKSDTVNSPGEPLIQYKKIKEPGPNLHEYKKKESKYENLKEEPKENLDLLLTDETTTRQQKRWKKKESGGERLKQDRQKKTSTTKRYRSRKKTTKQINFDDDGLSFQLVHRNNNDTNNNKPSHFPSSDVPNNSKNNDMYNREMESNEKSAFKQYDRDSRQHDYTSKYNENSKSRYRSEKGYKHAQKLFSEPYEYDPTDTPKDMPVYAPMDAPMDMPMDAPMQDPLEISFDGGKVLETTKGHNSGSLKVNAFNIDEEAIDLERNLDSKRKSFIVATSGNVALPVFGANIKSAAKRFESKTTVAS